MSLDGPGGNNVNWISALRAKSQSENTRQLLRSEGGDRYRAAEALQHDLDRRVSGLHQALKLGEKYSKTLKLDDVM